MPPFKDLTGQTFGDLYVIENTHKKTAKGSYYWLCLCECGNITKVSSDKLTGGKTRSCGCLRQKHAQTLAQDRIEDLTNRTFGELKVVEYAGTRNRHALWKCRCSCGNLTFVTSGDLRKGTSSCGHLKYKAQGKSKTCEYRAERSRKRREQSRGLDVEWTSEMTSLLKQSQPGCVVCGMTEEEHLEMYGESLHIDHVLPLSKGFGLKPGNAVVLCRKHNCSKGSKTEYNTLIALAAKAFEVLWNTVTGHK